MSKENRDSDHIWHVWISQRQEERQKENKLWEQSLYEFKRLLAFLSYGAKQIADAFEGKLPQTHQQCSHQPVEQLKVLNVLKCSRDGVDVTKCPILQSLSDSFEEQTKILSRPKSVLYDLMAKTCAWHVYTKAISAPEGHQFSIDTTEGYLLDTTDRMFWDRVYSNLSETDPEYEHPSPFPTGVEA